MSSPDPIFKAAVDLKKELADVKSPEIDAIMAEIMKTILGATKTPEKGN